MSVEKGNLSIESENILPIIKKWLYSDTDIFIRELVSNASDAITKLKKLVDIGEASHIKKDEEYKINIILDKENKIIKIIDNGIGMTKDEVNQFINQIAFSGATAFIQQYDEKLDSENNIIGHFGLGFYSAFMVANKVSINTLSFVEDAKACIWTSDGGVEYEISSSDKKDRGTEIILHIGEDGEEFLDEFKLRSILRKYCMFMPVNIYFDNGLIKEDDEEEIKPLNNTNPLWLKNPTEVTDEEYIEFYHELFNDMNEPLFWMHLNMDYPFRLKGILYFPKLKHELESIEGQVKLYNNQVFIADNVKEILPEFLLLLKGAIDCPDIPLNVSRSFLQNDSTVSKMSTYIVRKVADRINTLFKNEKEKLITYWNDISPFIKYGCINDKKFYERIKASILYRTINDEYLTLEELTENFEKDEIKKIYYVTNEQQQSQYIKMFKENNMNGILLTTNLDNPFISYIENYEHENKISFARIDADITDNLKSDSKEYISDEDKNILEKFFKESLGNENLKIEIEELKSKNVPAMILLSEEERRMKEMYSMFGDDNMRNMSDGSKETLVLNSNNNLIKLILKNNNKDEQKDNLNLLAKQIYDLAMISHKPLDSESMSNFIERSYEVFEKLLNN